eukprot:g5904.t1
MCSTDDDNRMIEEAWTHAASLSADGQLQQAIMGFLSLRELLEDQNRKLQGFDTTVPAGRNGPPGPASRGNGAAQTAARLAGARQGAVAVVEKLLSKARARTLSPLPKPRNKFWLYLYKTGGADSSPLFAVIRAAYEALATSRGRALHKAAVAARDCGAEFRWAVDVGAASSWDTSGGGGVPRSSSSQGGVEPTRGGRQVSPPKDRKSVASPGSSDGLFCQSGFRRGSASAGTQEGRPGASRQGQTEGRRREAQHRGEPEKRDSARGGAKGGGAGRQGIGRDAEGRAGRPVTSDAGAPSAAPTRQARVYEKRRPGRHQAGETQSGEGEQVEDEAVGIKGGHQASVGTKTFIEAFRPLDSNAASFTDGGGSHESTIPLKGRQRPRNLPDGRPVEEDGDVAHPRILRTPVSRLTGSPLPPPPSQPAAARTASRGDGASAQASAENAARSSGRQSAGKSSAAGSAIGSSGERSRGEGERKASESCSSHALFRDQVLEDSARSSSCSDGASGSGFSDGGGDGGGGGDGCVQRLRERVTTRGRGQHHNATACATPTYAYEIQREVDFWVSGARREGVSRKHASLGGGSAQAATEDGGTPICAGGAREPRQETSSSRRERGRRRATPPESGGDAIDRLVRAATSGDEDRKGGLFDRNSSERRKAAEGAPTHSLERITRQSFEKIEISSTTATTAAGARCGHTKVIRMLLAEGADIEVSYTRDVLDDSGELASAESRPLHTAASRANLDATRVLRDAGAHPNRRDAKGSTPLIAACVAREAGRRLVVVRQLLESGAHPAVTNMEGFTPLHFSSALGDTDVADTLLARAPAIVDAASRDGTTPLSLAVSRGQESTVACLLRHGAGSCAVRPRQQDVRSVLVMAVDAELENIVRLRVDDGPAAADLRDAVHAGVWHSSSKIVHALLDGMQDGPRKVAANHLVGGAPMLHLAAASGSPATTRVLLRAGALEAFVDARGERAADVIGAALPTGAARNPNTKAAIGRMLERGPACRARSWAWESIGCGHSGRTGGSESRCPFGVRALSTVTSGEEWPFVDTGKPCL